MSEILRTKWGGIDLWQDTTRVFPFAIFYERWAYCHRINFKIWNRCLSFWIYGKSDSNLLAVNLIPHYKWGTGGILGTLHGDFVFKVNEFVGSSISNIRQRTVKYDSTHIEGART